MKSFEQIEKEFLKIKGNDFKKQIDFYNQNKDLIINNLDFKNQYETEKTLWILSEVALAFTDYKLLNEGVQLSFKIKKWFKVYSKTFKVDVSNDTYYKLIIGIIANYHFNRKRYFRSYIYYRKLHLIDKQKVQMMDLMRVSLFRFIKQIANISVVLAILILSIRIILISTIDTQFFDNYFWRSIDLFLFAFYLIGVMINNPKINTKGMVTRS